MFNSIKRLINSNILVILIINYINSTNNINLITQEDPG